jgi:hypothetical protein
MLALALALNPGLRCLAHLDQHIHRSATAAVAARPERPQLDQRLLAAAPHAHARECVSEFIDTSEGSMSCIKLRIVRRSKSIPHIQTDSRQIDGIPITFERDPGNRHPGAFATPDPF